ncbi:hypothetical protein [Streptomyces celluloflavus]|uniref:hypothetical protein n=1 Tax=Streptomyces celluloflavus TaxID=58344 RepID=UPI003664A094
MTKPTRLTEERAVTIAVTGIPDITTYSGSHSVVPATVTITYRWQHPEHRDSWYEPGATTIKVTGPRRLKSGGAGHGLESVSFYGGRTGRDRPQWLTALVAQHLPEGWGQ